MCARTRNTIMGKVEPSLRCVYGRTYILKEYQKVFSANVEICRCIFSLALMSDIVQTIFLTNIIYIYVFK